MTTKGIIAVVGVDGAGKSTLLDHLTSRGYATSSWKSIGKCAGCSSSPPAIRSYIDTLTTTRLCSGLPPLSRFSLTLSVLFAEYEYCVRPALQKWGYVIVDSYYLKALARDLVRGFEWPRLIDINAFIPRPDGILHLDVCPEVGFERKAGNISEYEVRFRRDREDFIGFQRDVSNELLRLTANVPVITIDGMQDSEEVCRSVCDVLGPVPEDHWGGR